MIIIVVKNRPPHVKNPGYAPVYIHGRKQETQEDTRPTIFEKLHSSDTTIN